MGITLFDFTNSAPLVTLVLTSLLTLVVESMGRDKPIFSYWVSLLGVVAALLLSFFNLESGVPVFGGMLLQGGFAGYCNVVFLS